jgi:aldose 1-epimerase
MTINRNLWDTHEEKDIYLYTLNHKNITVNVSNLGCIVQSIFVGDTNVVLGYETATEYLNDSYYLGCVIGRYAGRIANAMYTIDGINYSLTKNEQPAGNHLHGGHNGLNKKIFDVLDEGVDGERAFVTFYTTSPDGEEGQPGDVCFFITIALYPNGAVSTRYEATSNKATHINLTHHHYFDLSGCKDNALNQQLQINATHYKPSPRNYVPGDFSVEVKESPFDFTSPRVIKKSDNTEVYNIYYEVNNTDEHSVAARLSSPASGIEMELRTTYPCIVLYTGDFLNKPFNRCAGICLETQMFPDSPNQPNFPSTLLRPGRGYFHETTMLFKAS